MYLCKLNKLIFQQNGKLCRYLHVTIERAAIQARDEISSVDRCNDNPNSMIELTQSPNTLKHCCRCKTIPLSNTNFSSFGCTLFKQK